MAWAVLKPPRCFPAGVPGELRQRHAPQERHRPADLRPARAHPALVVVRPHHPAVRAAGLRGRGLSPPRATRAPAVEEAVQKPVGC